MTRLFIEDLSGTGTSIKLDKKTSHYVKKVLRSKEGDKLLVFDGSGSEYECSVSMSGDGVTLEVKRALRSEKTPAKHIIMLQGVLKGQKMDLVAQKLSETGIKSMIPVITERSQVRNTSKRDRWIKIAREASRQCGRTDVMEVLDPVTFRESLRTVSDNYKDSLKLVFYEGGGGSLASLEGEIASSRSVLLFVGPEGGFSVGEISELRENGFHIVGLEGFILRAETASIVVSGIVQYIVNK